MMPHQIAAVIVDAVLERDLRMLLALAEGSPDDMIRVTTFTYTSAVPGYPDLMFDVDLAEKLAQAGLVVHLLDVPREALEHVAQNNSVDASRVPHVDVSQPGLAIEAYSPDEQLCFIIIDGTHRACKALMTGETFKVRMLHPLAARACCMNGVEKLR